ncbi:hypothetical protein Y032_0002g507 [Ancylostoma ceylanicum]|uniref:ShKT domain-containing protein n=1 Tax=Ancylostoma ceylanicum TaxID=53326 RepID=A0A016W1M4_9BILA|nr:hypothetical protein Y032_0002g507 [Ancylostoma ceylanicum]
MQPFFPMVNTDGLSNAYTDNLYSYAPRPTCSAANTAGCGSKFLFCDLSHGAPRCAAKIAVDGNCGGYTRNEDRCYLSVCQQNRCVRIQNEPTTQPPIITTTPAGPTQETCFNEQQCCAPWANQGQCRANPVYMNAWCKASCGICRPTTYNINIECADRHGLCRGWASNGECYRNPSWMAENCRQSCALCGTTRAQACNVQSRIPTPSPPPATTQPPSSGGTCLNQHFCCIAWASRGYCSSRNTYAYMTQYCQPSCNLCRGSTPNSLWNSLTCTDFSSQCGQWSRQGQCNSNSAFMWENCKRTCGRCSLLSLAARLISCQFSRRLHRNRHPVSDFGVSPFSLPLRRQSSLVSLAPGSLPQVSLAPAPAPKPLPSAARRNTQRQGGPQRPPGVAVLPAN